MPVARPQVRQTAREHAWANKVVASFAGSRRHSADGRWQMAGEHAESPSEAVASSPKLLDPEKPQRKDTSQTESGSGDLPASPAPNASSTLRGP